MCTVVGVVATVYTFPHEVSRFRRFLSLFACAGGGQIQQNAVLYTRFATLRRPTKVPYIIKISRAAPDGGGSAAPCSLGHGIPSGPYMVVLHHSRIGARPTPSARAARRVLMGWIARRSGRFPLPPAQAGGALCPRARGGSARTNIREGSTPAELYNNQRFAQFFILPGARCAPGNCAKCGY